MSDTTITVPDLTADRALLADMLLWFQVQRFYFDEATILDEHRYEDWLELFSDDTHYFMPIRRTRTRRELAKEFTEPGQMAYFDDTKDILIGRVKKLNGGAAWAEDPPSRTRHLITNVRVVADRGDELDVESNFHLYRTRLKSEEDAWIGIRRDTLRRHDGSFLIAKRHIFLEQTILLARNLSNFF